MADWTCRQLAAEFMALALFVWIGTGAAVAASFWSVDDADAGKLITIAIAFGFGISVLAYGIGHISGGHINPAVTLAFMVLGEQSIVSGVLYMAAQFIGAIFGSFIVWGCFASLTQKCESGDDGVCAANLQSDGGFGPAFNLGLNQVGETVSTGCAFLLELMGTFLLVITVLNSAVNSKSTAGNAAPIAIGWSVTLCHIILVPFTGCGINPARSFGPMIVDSIAGISSVVWIRGWWVFYTAPFVGALLAAATYKFIFEEPKDSAEKDEPDAEQAEEVGAA